MALEDCPDCGHGVSPSAEVCPGCGRTRYRTKLSEILAYMSLWPGLFGLLIPPDWSQVRIILGIAMIGLLFITILDWRKERRLIPTKK